MKTKISTFIIFAISILITGIFYSCHNEEDDDVINGQGNNDKEIEKALNSITTEWGISSDQVKKHMDGYKSITSQKDLLLFTDDKKSSYYSYKFKNDSLYKSLILIPQISGNANLSSILNGYTFVGEMDNTKIYINNNKNVLVCNYETNKDNTEFQVVGFTPISSTLLSTLSPIIVSTGDAYDVKYGSAIVSGTISGLTSSMKIGVFYDIDETLPTFSRQSITTDAADEFTIKISGLKVNTTYYYQIYAVVDNIYYLGEIKSFTTLEVNLDSSLIGTENGHEYVDLGLSVKWATCNIGSSSPEQYGGYYAWGETTEKNSYSWSTYTHCDGSSSKCHNIGDDIAGTEYDVAHVKWGGSWRMPTKEQFEELMDNCSWIWIRQNGVNGTWVIGPNGAYIFLPAAGIRKRNGLSNEGERGAFWSSSLDPNDDKDAFDLYFDSDNCKWGGNYRVNGLSVRPVCP